MSFFYWYSKLSFIFTVLIKSQVSTGFILWYRRVWWISQFFSNFYGIISIISILKRIFPLEFNIVLVELLIITCKMGRFYRFLDKLLTIIKRTVALSFTYFRQAVPRSNLALSKQNLSWFIARATKYSFHQNGWHIYT